MTAGSKARSLSGLPLLLAAGVLPLLMAPGLKDAYLLPKLFAAASLVLAAALLGLAESRGAKAVRTGLELPVAAFAVVAFASACFSIDGWPGWAGQYGFYSYGILGWVLCAAAFFLAAHERGGEFPVKLATWIAAGSLPVAAYALMQRAGIDPYLPSAVALVLQPEPRPVSTIGAPVPLGAYLMIAVPPAMSLLGGKRLSDKALGAAALGCSVAALAATRTRGAWLGALGGALVFAWLCGAFARHRAAAGLAAACVIAGGLWLAWGRRPAADLERWEIWRTALAAFRGQPILGVGPGAFLAAFRLHVRPEYARVASAGTKLVQVQFDAHNDWIQVLTTMGLLGAAAYAWLHWRALALLFSSGARMSRECAAFAGSLAGLFIQAKTGAMSWLAMFLGALIAGSLFGGWAKPAGVSRRIASAGMALLAAGAAAVCGCLAWADLQAGLGRAERAAGRPRDGAMRLEAAVAWNPYETSYRLDLDNLLWGVASEIGDDGARRMILGRAAEVALAGVRLRPGDAGAYRLLALAEMKRFEWAGEDRLAQARAALDAASRLNPMLLWLQEDRRHLDALSAKGGG